MDTTELNHHHLGGFLMLPDLGVWGLIPKEVSLPAGLPACLAPQTPCLGRRPTIRLAVLEAAHQCRDFEERATGWHGRALGFRVPDHTALPDTVEVRTCAWGSPGPPNLYTLRIPARTLQRPPPMSKLLKGTGLCHPLWDWAFASLFHVLAGQITPPFHPLCLPEWQQRHLSGHAGHRYLGCQHLRFLQVRSSSSCCVWLQLGPQLPGPYSLRDPSFWGQVHVESSLP